MADLSCEIRRERYRILRKYGYSRGWAQRARDFTNKNFLEALFNEKKSKKRNVKIMKEIKESSIDVLPEYMTSSRLYIRPIRESKTKKE